MNNVLCRRQFDFRPCLNALDASTKYLDHICYELNNKHLFMTILLDSSLAFDTVNHEILLEKLRCYGVRTITLQWFKSYFGDRQQ